jgi:hypothetical protein
MKASRSWAKQPGVWSDVLVQAAVEAGIEVNRMVQRVGGRVLVVVGDFLELVEQSDHAVGHVQPDHRDFQPAVKTAVGRVRVVPDVGLGDR